MVTPSEFVCPISLTIMKTPVVTPCRHTFDREALTQWLRQNPTCPFDRQLLQIEGCADDQQLRKRIKKYLKDHPEENAQSQEGRNTVSLMQRVQERCERVFHSNSQVLSGGQTFQGSWLPQLYVL